MTELTGTVGPTDITAGSRVMLSDDGHLISAEERFNHLGRNFGFAGEDLPVGAKIRLNTSARQRVT